MRDLKFWLPLLVSIIGVALPFYVWQADRPTKNLSVIVWSTIPLIQPLPELDGLELVINGQKVKHLDVTTVEVRNTGNQPIARSDFATPIELQIGENSRIFRTTAVEIIPASIKADVSNTDRAVAIQPLLLNPGDIIRLSILTVQGRPDIATTTRISGVKDVAVLRNDPGRVFIARVDWKYVLSTCVLAAIYAGAASFAGRAHGARTKVLAAVTAGTVAFPAVVMAGAVLRSGYVDAWTLGISAFLMAFVTVFLLYFFVHQPKRRGILIP